MKAHLDRFALIVIMLALLVRVGLHLSFFSTYEYPTGSSSDMIYYWRIAQEPWRLGIPGVSAPEGYESTPFDFASSIAPGYPLFIRGVSEFAQMVPGLRPVPTVRVAQLLLDTGTVALTYLIAAHVFGKRVGRVALVVQAFDPRHIYLANVFLTETLFIVLVALGMWLYLTAANRWRWLAGSAAVFGLAALTRPIVLLFPLVLTGHLWLTHPAQRQQIARVAAGITAVIVLMAGPWILRSSLLEGEFVPGAESAYVHLWQQTIPDGRDIPPEEYAARLRAEGVIPPDEDNASSRDFLQAAAQNIAAEPLMVVGRVVGDVAAAYVQPFGTVFTYEGLSPSLKQMAVGLLRGETSPGNLLSVQGFFPRLLMYGWQMWSVGLGAVGAVLAWREHDAVPLIAWPLYLTLTTALLLIEPRYVFPGMFTLTILGAYAALSLWDLNTVRRGENRIQSSTGH